MTKLAKALQPQWKNIYTKRTFKTGVSEALTKFDEEYFKALGTPFIYDESSLVPNKTEAKDAYNVAERLDKDLKDKFKKGPKVGKWTDKEKVFLRDLLNDLGGAMSFLSKHK